MLLEGLGCVDVRTYIQSGNVVFRHKERQAGRLSRTISEAVLNRFHFAPFVLPVTVNHLKNALAANPFSTAEEKPKTLHLYFLSVTPTEADLDGLNQIKSASERFELASRTGNKDEKVWVLNG